MTLSYTYKPCVLVGLLKYETKAVMMLKEISATLKFETITDYCTVT